jgi:hypothetical protein
VTSGVVTTTTNGQYIFGCNINVAFLAMTKGTTFTSPAISGIEGGGAGTEYLVQAFAGSTAATFTTSNTTVNVISAVATFKAAAAAPRVRRRVIIQ